MSDDQTRPAAGPMYYDDGEFIHACESSIVNGGVRQRHKDVAAEIERGNANSPDRQHFQNRRLFSQHYALGTGRSGRVSRFSGGGAVGWEQRDPLRLIAIRTKHGLLHDGLACALEKNSWPIRQAISAARGTTRQ
jgi:hypothetical protein